MVLMFAGIDTTAYVAAETTCFLVKHPQWLDALWEEQQRLIAEYGEHIDRRVQPLSIDTSHCQLQNGLCSSCCSQNEHCLCVLAQEVPSSLQYSVHDTTRLSCDSNA